MLLSAGGEEPRDLLFSGARGSCPPSGAVSDALARADSGQRATAAVTG